MNDTKSNLIQMGPMSELYGYKLPLNELCHQKINQDQVIIHSTFFSHVDQEKRFWGPGNLLANFLGKEVLGPRLKSNPTNNSKILSLQDLQTSRKKVQKVLGILPEIVLIHEKNIPGISLGSGLLNKNFLVLLRTFEINYFLNQIFRIDQINVLGNPFLERMEKQGLLDQKILDFLEQDPKRYDMHPTLIKEFLISDSTKKNKLSLDIFRNKIRQYSCNLGKRKFINFYDNQII